MELQQKKESLLPPFSILAAVISTVIGVGIFWKNRGVFKKTGDNIGMILAAWMIIAFICICTAYVYSKFIATCKETDGGYCGLAREIVGNKFSRFLSKVFIFFKLGIAIPGYCFYSATVILRIFKEILAYPELTNDFEKNQVQIAPYSTMSMMIVGGLIILISVMAFNYYKPTTAIKAQETFLYLKFIPIIMIIVFGIFNKIAISTGWVTLGTEAKSVFTLGTSPTGVWPTINKMFAAFPGIMLAFDAFLNTSFYYKKAENAKRNIPRISVAVVCVLTAVYLTVTGVQYANGTGRFYELFHADIYGLEFGTMLKLFSYSCVFISAIGLINGYCTTAQPMINKALDDDLFSFCSIVSQKVSSRKQQVMWIWGSITGFWSFLILAFCLGQNGDSALDGFTNIPVIILFCCYGVLPLYYSKKLWKANTKLTAEVILIYICSAIAFIGWSVIASYIFVDLMFLKLISPTAVFDGWDGPLGANMKNFKLQNWGVSLIMMIGFVMLFGGHYLDEKIRTRNSRVPQKVFGFFLQRWVPSWME